MSEPTEAAVLAYRVTRLEEELGDITRAQASLMQTLDDMEKAAIEREKNRLLYGIGALGTLVGTLVSVIWTYRSVIFK